MQLDMIFDFISFFILTAGFIIGLGAVTVIDLHGFFARKSTYWTEATTRTHKITKPLIWIGTIFVFFGSMFVYGFSQIGIIQLMLLFVMILNGLFLSFKVSPYLLTREKNGESSKILPASWQRKIQISFIFSVVCWWGSVLLFVWYNLQK